MHLRKNNVVLKIIFSFLSLPALWLVLPGLPISFPSISLDESWKIALQTGFDKKLIFGKDIIFTYGPLGFLSSRMAADSTKFIIIAYDIFIFLQFLLIPFFVYSLSPSFFSIAGLLITYSLLGFARYYLDPATILFLMSSFWIFCFLSRESLLIILLAILNGLLCFYVKVNMGLAALLQIALVGFVYLSGKNTRKKSLLIFSLLAVFLFLSALFINVSLFNYVKASLHIANGYNDALYLKLSDAAYLKKSLIMLAALLTAIFISIFSQKKIIVPLCCLGFSYLLFKQSFVRADEHIFMFFDYIIMPFAFLAFFTAGKTRIFNTLVFFLAAGFILYDKPASFKIFKDRYNSFHSYLKAAALHDSDFKPSPQLPQSIADQVGGSSVDLMPDNISLLYHSGLNYVPRPVIQSYTVYDNYLDRINADFLRKKGQDYIVFSHGCVDYRYCLHDEALTKISLLENYSLARQEGSMFLLERNRHSRPFIHNTGKKGKNFLKKEFKITPSNGILLIKFKIDYSLKGKIVRFLYKPPPLYIIIKTSDSREHFRAILPILNGGVIANIDVRSEESIKNFLTHNFRDIPKVEWVKFHTDFPWAFKQQYDFEVEELIPNQD